MCKSTRYSVFGYLRSSQQIFPSSNPYYNLYGNTIIISTILLFYDEPELFEMNNKSSFKYDYKIHGNLFHAYGVKTITKGVINKYKWKIKTNATYQGTFGVIDVEGISNVKKNDYLWYNSVKDLAFVGSKISCWSSSIFNVVNTSSFVEPGDTITIEIDYDKDSVSFTSEISKETKTGKLKEGLKSVKFIAEFDVNDSVMSFVE